MTSDSEVAAEGIEEGPLLNTMMNLARFHRDHERFYAAAPRESALHIQRQARALQSLADRWSNVEVGDSAALSPFEGAEDLNDPAALQLEGVLFMEGEGRPAELTAMIRDLRTHAEDCRNIGEWLTQAMQASWQAVRALLDIDELADVLGERHRIISNDWLAASMNTLIAELLDRAADMIDRIDFAPAAVRADLTGQRVLPRRLYSAAELLARAADLLSESAGLVHDNERRWRVFHRCVSEVVDATTTSPRA
ncbi:MAG TPA: hypothetical protein VLR27_03970 [Acidimicrobiales bacterium]|nr:hypothetical protein [Acidimicrobiales bacterium]